MKIKQYRGGRWRARIKLVMRERLKVHRRIVKKSVWGVSPVAIFADCAAMTAIAAIRNARWGRAAILLQRRVNAL